MENVKQTKTRVFCVDLNGRNGGYFSTFEKALASFSNKIEKEIHGMDIEQGLKAQYVLKNGPFNKGDFKLAHIGWIDVQ